MNTRRRTWLSWAGLLLSVAAFLSYPLFFSRWPITRDVPWANLLLFAGALFCTAIGLRRAVASGEKRRTIFAAILGTLCVTVFGLFLAMIFVGGRKLPSASGAPQVGQRAPDFTLNDSSGKLVSFAELRSAPIDGHAPKGVLLVFYRGYW